MELKKPVSPKELNTNSLNYGFPVKEGNYHKSPVLYGESNSSLVIQSTPLKLKSLGNGALELGFTDKTSSKSKQFYKALSQLEMHAVNTIHLNSEKWFGKSIPLDKIKNMYKLCIFPPPSINGEVTIRLRISRNVDIVDQDGNQLSIENLGATNDENLRLSCMCRIDGILFGRNVSKLDIKIVQIKTSKVNNKPVVVPNTIPTEDQEVDEDMEDLDFLPLNPSDNCENDKGTEGTEEVDPIDDNNEDDNKNLLEETLNAELSQLSIQLKDALANDAGESKLQDIACEIASLKSQLN